MFRSPKRRLRQISIRCAEPLPRHLRLSPGFEAFHDILAADAPADWNTGRTFGFGDRHAFPWCITPDGVCDPQDGAVVSLSMDTESCPRP
jgi:hypothetical protein